MSRACAIILFLAITVAELVSARVVVKPAVTYARATNIEIERIELSDTATVMHFSAHYRPGWWVTISRYSTIEVDGTIYPLLRSEGVGDDDRIVFPPSGSSEFTLYFPPIPADAVRLNYYEGPRDSYGGFHLYDVDLTGRADMLAVPAGVPDTLLSRSLDVPCPRAVFANDSAVVRVRMLDWHPGLMDLIFFTEETTGHRYGAAIDSTGCGKLVFKPYFTTRVDVTAGRHVYFGSFLTAPGDTVTLYLDAKAGADFLYGDIVPPRRLYADGLYRDYNYMYDTDNTADVLYVKHFTPVFADYTRSSDSFTDGIIAAHRNAVAELDSMDIPQLVAEAGRARLDYELLLSALRHRDMCALEYENTHLGFQIAEDSIVPRLDSVHYARVASVADAGDPRYLLFGAWNADFYDGTFHNPRYDGISLLARKIKSAGQLRLTEADLDSLSLCVEPYFADICEDINDRISGSLPADREWRADPLPDVPDDEIVEAIVRKYPGKVVVFDFWDSYTYSGIDILYGSSAKMDEGLVWIHITDTSTPLPDYYEMATRYKNPGYYLDESQALALWKKYCIDERPFYIVAGRDGKLEYGPHLRNYQLLKSIIDECLCGQDY